MAKPVIDQIVVWTHPFFTAKHNKHIQDSKLTKRELDQALSVILREMKKTVDALAGRKGTAFVLVGSDFNSVLSPDGKKYNLVGVNEAVGRAYSKFLHHCRKRFGDRFVLLSPEVGYTGITSKNEETRMFVEREVEKGLRKLKGFDISQNVILFRAGEQTMGCVKTANSWIGHGLKKVFEVEVRPDRMQLIAEHSFNDIDAIATLETAGRKRKFLPRAERPEYKARFNRHIH